MQYVVGAAVTSLSLRPRDRPGKMEGSLARITFVHA